MMGTLTMEGGSDELSCWGSWRPFVLRHRQVADGQPVSLGIFRFEYKSRPILDNFPIVWAGFTRRRELRHRAGGKNPQVLWHDFEPFWRDERQVVPHAALVGKGSFDSVSMPTQSIAFRRCRPTDRQHHACRSRGSEKATVTL